MNPHVDFAFPSRISDLHVFPLSAAKSFTEICAEIGSTHVLCLTTLPQGGLLLGAVGCETPNKPFSVSTGLCRQAYNTDFHSPYCFLIYCVIINFLLSFPSPQLQMKVCTKLFNLCNFCNIVLNAQATKVLSIPILSENRLQYIIQSTRSSVAFMSVLIRNNPKNKLFFSVGRKKELTEKGCNDHAMLEFTLTRDMGQIQGFKILGKLNSCSSGCWSTKTPWETVLEDSGTELADL